MTGPRPRPTAAALAAAVGLWLAVMGGAWADENRQPAPLSGLVPAQPLPPPPGNLSPSIPVPITLPPPTPRPPGNTPSSSVKTLPIGPPSGETRPDGQAPPKQTPR